MTHSTTIAKWGQQQRTWSGVGDDTSINRLLGDRLRDHYQSIIREPTPDRLIELLRRIEKRTF
jgi:hypothetical protein